MSTPNALSLLQSVNLQDAGFFSALAYASPSVKNSFTLATTDTNVASFAGALAVAGWQDVTSQVLGGLGNGENFDLNSQTAFRIFANPYSHEIVIAFRGSVIAQGNAANFVADLDASDQGSSSYQAIAPLAEAALVKLQTPGSAWSNYTIVTDGHSLGGEFAQAFALQNNLNGFGQNSLSIAPNLQSNLNLPIGFNAAVTTYQQTYSFQELNVQGDPASDEYGGNLFQGKYLSTAASTYWLASPYSASEDALIAIAGAVPKVGSLAVLPAVAYDIATAHSINTVNSLAMQQLLPGGAGYVGGVAPAADSQTHDSALATYMAPYVSPVQTLLTTIYTNGDNTVTTSVSGGTSSIGGGVPAKDNSFNSNVTAYQISTNQGGVFVAFSAADTPSVVDGAGTSSGDYLIGSTSPSTLIGGSGSNTLVGGNGNTLMIGGSGQNQYLYDNLGTVPTTAEIANTNGSGTVWVGSTQLTGTSNAAQNVTVGSATDLIWTAAGGTQYQFAPGDSFLEDGLGTLTISGGIVGSGGTVGDQIIIDNFNLTQAQSSPTGELGISFMSQGKITVGAMLGSNTTGIFPAGSQQSYTYSVDVPSNQAQVVTFTLTGASPSDFEVAFGTSVTSVNSNGTFTVTLAAGQTSVSFGLVDVTGGASNSDIASGANLQLTAALPNLTNPGGPAIVSSPLSIKYTPSSIATYQPNTSITGTLNSATGITTYQGDGANDAITGTGTSNSIVGGNGSDSIIAGPGTNTIFGGSGNSTIIGSGATDLIFGGSGNNQIMAGTKTTLTSAIAQAQSASATNTQGDLISVLDGNNTVIGGNGNDLIAAGAGSDVIVLGSGNDTFTGGTEVTNGTANWSATVTPSTGQGVSNDLSTKNVTLSYEGFTNPYAQPYNGSTIAGTSVPDGPGNDTIYAGNGNDFISLGNGNNFVQAGSGVDTIFGGMGNDTILAGSGTDFIRGGGGNTYIAGGSGTDSLIGGDGNNTIIGGSGNSTIYSANGPFGYSNGYAGANLEQNYIDGGSGNDLILGGSGSDTLIAGTGNSSIYGGIGNESIVGGTGNDVLSADAAANATISAGGAGSDTLVAGTVTSGTYFLSGGNGTDLIFGGSGTNVLFAGDGGSLATGTTSGGATSVIGSEDSTSNTTIYGGAGLDFLQGGAGNTVIYAGDGGTSAGATSLVAGTGNTTIYGGLGTDFVQGGSGTNVLYAGDGGIDAAPTTVNAGTGVATIVGGAGASILRDTVSGQDVIEGGSYDDTIVATGNDTIVAGTGSDYIQSTGANLTIQANAGFGAVTVNNGGASNNLSFGAGIAATDFSGAITFDSAGNSYLDLEGDGGSVSVSGALTGSLGTISFADSGTISTASLLAGAFGSDQTVASSKGASSFVLGVTGSDSISATSLTDTIASWAGSTTVLGTAAGGAEQMYVYGDTSQVYGGAGSDTISTFGSADTVYSGSAGAATGNTINVSGDLSVVYGGSGYDQIVTTGNSDTVFSGSIGTAGVGSYISILGNQSAAYGGVAGDSIYVSGANDTVFSGSLAGTVGNQISAQFGGSNVIYGGAGFDSINDGDYSDTIYSGTSGAAVTLTGGNNLFISQGGASVVTDSGSGDTLIGGTGSDEFILSNATTVIQAPVGANDTIFSSASYVAPTNVNTLTLTGSANIVGTGNDGNDMLTAGSGNDTLIAGAGTDTLISGTGVDTLFGGTGPDTFYVNNSADFINPSYTGYQDTINSSVSYALTAAVGTVNLTGSANLTASDLYGYSSITGNSGNDTLTGGSGADTLVAGTGLTTMNAGTGYNTFVVNNTADVIQATSSAGSDTVNSSVSYTLGQYIDNLTLTGSNNLVGTGNSDATNYIVGNAGSDTLIAGSGSDTLVAGSGVDTLVAGTGTDVLQGQSGDTYALGINNTKVEISTASGTGTIDFGTGIAASALTVGMTIGSDGAPAMLLQDGSLSVTVDGGLTGSIGQFDFADGTQLSLAQLLSGAGSVTPNTIVGANGNAVFNTSAAASLTGGIGNDTIIGTGASDTIIAGSGNQQIYGIGSGDILAGSSGSDTLFGGVGSDTLVAGTGRTVMYGGQGDDTYSLTQGGVSVLYAGATPGVEQIFLPTGMTMSQFTYSVDPQDSGTLILQSLTGDTTVFIPGYYTPGSSAAKKLWVLTDATEAPQILNPPAQGGGSGTAYQQQIAALEKGYSAKLAGTLRDIGLATTSVPPNYIYSFGGVATQNVTVQGGVATLGESVVDQISYFPSTTTIYESVPTYVTQTIPGATHFYPLSSLSPLDLLNIENNPSNNVVPVYANGSLTGYDYIQLPAVNTVQTGTKQVPVTVAIRGTNESIGFTVYNVTGDGGNDTITATGVNRYANNSGSVPPFVGTVNTNNGNVSVDLGGFTGGGFGSPYSGGVQNQSYQNYFTTSSLGAFIQAGSGNDTISGTGGADLIAAGTGFDYLQGGAGTTYYAPMQGYSTEVIGDPTFPYGGAAASDPGTTLVLPTGITLQNLSYRLFQDPSSGSEVLELKNGNSSILVNYWMASSPYQGSPNGPGYTGTVNVASGVSNFQFSNGTVLTYAQLLTELGAQSTLLPNDFNPVVNAGTSTVQANQSVAATSLFSVSDTVDNPVTWYQISNSGAGGGQFLLNGQVQASGQPFMVNASQLSQLSYVGGAAASSDVVTVSAFDGAVWSTPDTFDVTPIASVATYTATAPNQVITGPTTGVAATLTAAFANDTLVGGTGINTFVVGDPSVVVQDQANGGQDTIESSVSYTLAANVQNLILTGSAALVGTANSLNDQLTANAGSDTLVSGSGVDTLVGGTGNDLFVVNNSSDVVAAGASGIDTIASAVSYTLSAGIDNLTFTGSANIVGTGNSDATNTITGNAGNDTLIAGAAVATLVGGTGSDLFIVNYASDTVLAGGSSNDTIASSVGFALIAGVDTLNLTGSGNLVGTGNSDATNTITGNAGVDTLVAGTAIATLIGGTGSEAFVINNASDVINVGSSTNDTVYSSINFTLPAGIDTLILTGTANLVGTGNGDTANTIVANAGSDTLIAGIAVADLIGGSGNDVFVINNSADTVVAGGNDTIISSVSYALPSAVDTMVLTGSANLAATGNADVSNALTANTGNDTLTAGSGSDTLISGTGVDVLNGGSGTDIFVVNNAADVVTNAYAGTGDSIASSVSYTLPTNVNALTLTGTAALKATSNAGNDVLTANSGADTLIAGNGVDTLISGSGIDSLVAGTGNDLLVVNNASDVITVGTTHGSDTVQSSVSLKAIANADTIVLTGTANLTAIGNADASNLISANAGNDSLTAGNGSDTLVSGIGIDTLTGGTGADLFLVNNAADLVKVGTTHGSDTISSSVSYTASANVTNLTLTGTANLVGTGNTLADVITSNSGNDTLTAGTGVATLVGGSGSDLFVVNNVSDVVQAGSVHGADSVQSSVTYTLPTTVDVLTLTGSASIVATGNNDAGNLITGNSGSDTLVAGSGTDTLIGGAGVDSLVGGAGNDLFVVNKTTDIVSVAAGSGNDTIQSSVSYTAAANVANLTLTGTANLSGNGNTLANVITANSGVDTLTAGTGVATLVAGTGNDTFVIDNAADVVSVGSTHGTDVIKSSVSYTASANVANLTLTGTANLVGTGNSLANVITANTGADTLVAGSGVATLVGGTGSDLFMVDNTADVVTVGSTHGIDTIQSSVSYTASTNVANLTLTGTANLAGTGNAIADVITANSGNDTLTAGTGVATLIGGSGNDLFVVNKTTDIVTVAAGSGNDTIQSSVSYIAAANVANLTLTGTANLSGNGNTLANVITANSGVDTLTAGTGVATLVAGTGNDTFVIDNAADVVSVGATHGTDVIKSSVSYTASANVANLTLTGTTNLVGTGNSLANVITANTGADTLVAGSGVATLVGGTGSDLFMVDNTADVVTVGSTHGIDTIQSSVSYTASTNVANLTLTGTANLAGTGNAIADVITANSGNDTLTAGTGVATLIGGSGSDLFVVNKTTDVISVAAGQGTDSIQSSVSYVLPSNVQYLALTGSANVTGTGNSLTDLIVGNTANDTLTGGTGIAVLEGGKTSGLDLLQATANQAALVAGAGASTIKGGAFKDFFAAGNVSDTITTGATANVIAVNRGDGATTIAPTTGAKNVLSLGGGIDTESLFLSKSGNNLVVTDGVTGDSITLTNWYAAATNQTITTLQVVEAASASYNASGTDALRNKAVETFNFTNLVSAFNAAGSPANYALSSAMPSANIAGSAATAYGGDLAYYYGLNGNLTGLNLSAAQSTLTNATFATSAQSIDAWSSVSSGSGSSPTLSLAAAIRPTTIVTHTTVAAGPGRALRPLAGTTARVSPMVVPHQIVPMRTAISAALATSHPVARHTPELRPHLTISAPIALARPQIDQMPVVSYASLAKLSMLTEWTRLHFSLDTKLSTMVGAEMHQLEIGQTHVLEGLALGASEHEVRHDNPKLGIARGHRP